jgi:hypothetical protein
MQKFVAIIVSWVLIGILIIPIKSIIDAALTPVTGFFAIMGVTDEKTIAVIGILPWLIPLAYFIGTCIYIVASLRQPQTQSVYTAKKVK